MKRVIAGLVSGFLDLRSYFIVGTICILVGAAGGAISMHFYKAGVMARHIVEDQKAAAALVLAHQLAVDDARQEEKDAAKITHDTDVAAALASIKIQTVYKTNIREVPTYVTPAADSQCVVPAGFVLHYNAGVAGTAVVPDPSGKSNDAPSGVALSDVARVTTENFTTYHQLATDHLALQDWVLKQKALADAGAAKAAGLKGPR